MLPQGDVNQTVIELDTTVGPHKHYASDIVNLQSRLDDILSQLRGRVPTEGDTLEKLYNLLISSTVEIIVPNIESRDALDIQNTFTNVFVLGEDSWELYKATSIGTNASFIKLSDSKMINNIIGSDVLTKSLLPSGNIATPDKLVLGNDARLTDSRHPLPHKHNVSAISGVDTLIDTKINNKLSNLNVGVLSINSKTGNLKLQKLDVGLDFVDNTPDHQKPVSVPQQAALDKKIDISRLPTLPTASSKEIVLGNDPRLSDSRYPAHHTHTLQDINNFSASVQNVLINLFDSTDVTVTSVNGRKGAVDLTATDVGLKYVNNTADLDKPVSKAQRNALDSKICKSMLPSSSVANPDQIVLGNDLRLKDARNPLPHTSNLITDFEQSVTALATEVVSSLINLDGFQTTDLPNTAAGEFTKVTVNSNGSITSGSKPVYIHDLGIEDVYTKSEVDTKISNMVGSTPNAPGGPAIVNEFGKLSNSVLPDVIQNYVHTGYFPHIGGKNVLYLDETNNVLYRYDGSGYVSIVMPDLPVSNATLPDIAKVATSGDYNDLNNIPNLAKVASTANYYDLENIPGLAQIATTGNYYDLVQRPTLSKVSSSGSYNDLVDLPTYQDVAISGSYLDLHNRPDLSQFASKTDVEFNQTKTLNFVGVLKPVNGTARWYPERNVTLLYAYVTVSDPSTNDIVCELNINSTPVRTNMVLDAQSNISAYFDLNTLLLASDYVTLNIIKADNGRNLSLTIVYR